MNVITKGGRVALLYILMTGTSVGCLHEGDVADASAYDGWSNINEKGLVGGPGSAPTCPAFPQAPIPGFYGGCVKIERYWESTPSAVVYTTNQTCYPYACRAGGWWTQGESDRSRLSATIPSGMSAEYSFRPNNTQNPRNGPPYTATINGVATPLIVLDPTSNRWGVFISPPQGGGSWPITIVVPPTYESDSSHFLMAYR